MNLMLRLTVFVTLLFYLISCSNSDNNSVVIDKRISPPEPDKDLREKYEAEKKTIATACVFDNPDTSISTIKLRDAESARKVLKVTRLQGDTTNYFYNRDNNEELGVTVHPGDYNSQVSIFQVKYADKSKTKRTLLPLDRFETEKGIVLGLTRQDVVERLGHCYNSIDSTTNSITINYRLESRQDSKTKLLQRQNMPIYYATYKFGNNKLVMFEFGFEYP